MNAPSLLDIAVARRKLKLVPPNDRDRDNLDAMLKEFLRKEPQEKEAFRAYMTDRFDDILSEVGDVNAKLERNYLEHKADFRGLAARLDAHDKQLDDIHDKIGARPHRGEYRTAPGARLVTSVRREPISIPPARVELDTGSFDGLTKESAKVMIAAEATRIATEAIVNHEKDGDAESWRATKKYILKVAGALLLIILSALVTSYGIGQCGKAHAATSAVVK